ncbi:MAG: carbohydrate ABC transporter permease [Planctomycetota bacterium]
MAALRSPWHRALATLSLALVAFLYITPILFMISAGFTPDNRVLAVRERGVLGSLLPAAPTLENYHDVFARMDFWLFMGNSLIVVGTTVLLGLFVNSMLAFALARLRWRGRKAVLLAAFALLVIPFEAIAIPLFFMASWVGMVDTYAVQIAPFVANPFAIILFYTFFRELPPELDQAARVDGASTWTIYWRIAVPLARPAFASAGILTFLIQWGAYLWPLMVTIGPEVRPLPVAIGEFPNEQPVQWGDIMAFATLMVVPVMLAFIVFQRWFVRGIAGAGLKG